VLETDRSNGAGIPVKSRPAYESISALLQSLANGAQAVTLKNGVSGLTDLTTHGIEISYVIQLPNKVENGRVEL
jgi:hypothetical protein